MQPEIKALLFDMQQACERISRFTKDKCYDDYLNDDICRSAVERQFIILGEALSRLLKHAPEFGSQIPAHRDIINFRNVLTHGYDRVEDEVVWGIVKKYLPQLQVTVERMMKNTS